jgi:glycosyltransferase involved in cell wall biosynthesis
VLFQHNVESVLWRRQAEHEPNALKRLAFSIEARKMARYEPEAVARFAHVIAVSEGDREAMRVMTDPARVSVVPTGVDVSEYRAGAGTPAVDPIVVFLGSMDWEANIDAVEYFCRDIWPAVRAAVPDAQFRIVGRNPHPRVLRLASTSVVVTGTVPAVLDHLKETAVFVVPLRIGGGTRLKIFEAMAAGRAVVSSSIGAEGLDVHDGRDIVLADTSARFAESVIGLLRDPLRRARIGRSATESAANHDWRAVAKQLEAILFRVAASADSRPEDSLAERVAI